ncbi:hypothetical protein TrVE_jg8951 [Triparma verrucosa]|uniref:Selenoprotein O n=1 Tax=Triparma verrucosa TaxID=1606542 RepID=A0A9W6Z421_9STRA|nr:hypothetical protein TrVE_jg8951 [Triparma verrucosa]
MRHGLYLFVITSTLYRLSSSFGSAYLAPSTAKFTKFASTKLGMSTASSAPPVPPVLPSGWSTVPASPFVVSSLPTRKSPNPVYSLRSTPSVIFSTDVPLQPIRNPKLASFDKKSLESVLMTLEEGQMDGEEGTILAEYLSGSTAMPNTKPSAHCYCGHQFGSFSGQLGDGATMYLTNVNGLELQLKGAGLTPYSRTADGRKVLRSSLREHVGSKYMDCLGVPTTTSPTLVVGENRIQRDKYYTGNISMERVAVVSRVARTFFRFGSFEICKPTDAKTGRAGPSAGDEATGQALFDFVAENYFEEVASSKPSRAEKGKAILKEVCKTTAYTCAMWQAVGFTHGVLNTDNMSILGITIDYGPYGFQEYFDWDHVPNGSDGTGRYDYKSQPEICKWNVMKLAESFGFCGVLDAEAGKAVVEEEYDLAFREAYEGKFRKKLGVFGNEEGDEDFIKLVLDTMAETRADFTETFVSLETYAESEGSSEALGATLDSLVGNCADVDAISSICKRKMKMCKPNMPPQQIIQLWEICQSDPERLAQHFGAPKEAIIAEIGGEMEKLGQYAALTKRMEEVQKMGDEELQEENRVKWRKTLSAYKERMWAGGGGGGERAKVMRENNPRFCLKNWILQDSIEKADKGDWSGIQDLMRAAESIYGDVEEEGGGGGGGGDTYKILLTKQREAPKGANDLYNT